MKIIVEDYHKPAEEIKIINLDAELEQAHNEGIC